MQKAYGLYGHIRANRVRSVILLLGFIALLHALQFSLLLIYNALQGGSFEYIVWMAANQFWSTWPFAAFAAIIWFGIAYAFHQAMIRKATGARGVTRLEEPKLYNALENLCISRGITMPALELIDTPALNAYAAGLSADNYVIAVTRGLVDKLDDSEIEAVLAHELTHIRNRDTQMMVIAVIFAGIFAFFGDLTVRRWDFPYGMSPRDKSSSEDHGWSSDGRDSDSNGGSGSSRDGGGGGAALAILLAIAILVISWGISTLIRFALSRSREYLADAGAVELTKNPDAMISALRKIEHHASFDVMSRMEAFFIENPVEQRLTGLLATHPTIAARVAALETYAGGNAQRLVDLD
ncbi:MAG: M48 family metallopeptidase [Hyphomicrobium sp.]